MSRPNGSLSKAHLKTFINSLRKQQERDFNNTFRFFAVGEYGTKTLRPHYHLILFGVKFDDLENLHKSFSSEGLQRSSRLEKLWKFGFSTIGEVTYASCCYVARYCMKKQFASIDDKKKLIKLGIVPEFSLMSRNPGIGIPNESVEFYGNLGSFFYNGRELSLTKYQREKLYSDAENELIKFNRELRSKFIESSIFSNYPELSKKEILRKEESSKLEQIKSLKRNL